MVEVLAGMPELHVLQLQGNPVTRKIQHYRKTVIARCLFVPHVPLHTVCESSMRYRSFQVPCPAVYQGCTCTLLVKTICSPGLFGCLRIRDTIQLHTVSECILRYRPFGVQCPVACIEIQLHTVCEDSMH